MLFGVPQRISPSCFSRGRSRMVLSLVVFSLVALRKLFEYTWNSCTSAPTVMNYPWRLPIRFSFDSLSTSILRLRISAFLTLTRSSCSSVLFFPCFALNFSNCFHASQYCFGYTVKSSSLPFGQHCISSFMTADYPSNRYTSPSCQDRALRNLTGSSAEQNMI